MSKPTVTVTRGRARKNELGDALINPLTNLASNTLMTKSDGSRWYLPVYSSAAQSTGGRESHTSSLTADGTLTFYLQSGPPPELATSFGGATAQQSGTSFVLLLNASGTPTRFPLQDNRQGDLHTLTVKLSGNDLKVARAALFDANPNVAIEVTQTLNIAAQQTQAFVEENWEDKTIRAGLLDSFGGIPFSSPSSFVSMIRQADPDYTNQYLVMSAAYVAQVAAPPLPGYIQWQVTWKERAYNYYQDNQDPSRVFYLPDRFELAKGPAGSPTVALLQFSLPAGSQAPDPVAATEATFRAYGKPVVDFDRVQNARQALQSKIGTPPNMVSLQDANNSAMTFTQYLPNAEGTASAAHVQTEAIIDLSTGLINELNLKFAQFRALWGAIFSAAPENPLFRGWVDVSLSGGKYQDRIDFDARLPKDQEAGFFNDILVPNTTCTYPTVITVSAFPVSFEVPADSSPQVLEISVIFTGHAAVVLTKTCLTGKVELQRSIPDIVMGKQSPDEYAYTLQVVRSNGTVCCSEGTARIDNPTLWLRAKQITDCTKECV